MSFGESLRQLAKNWNYLIIMATFGILCGLASAFTSLLTQIVAPYGVTPDDAGFLGAAFVLAGLVGSIVTGIFIDKTGRHQLVMKIYVPLDAVLYLAFYFIGKSFDRKDTLYMFLLIIFF